MANDQATLRGYLQSAVRDSSNETWTTTEMNNAIDRAVRNLAPRILRPLSDTTVSIQLAADTYSYSLTSGCVAVDRFDWVGSDGSLRGALQPGTWELTGDVWAGSGKVRVHPRIVDVDNTAVLYGRHAYGRYDTTTNYILDEHIELVIAQASVTLLHYLKSDRARFLQWQNTDQNQNTSANELLEIINNAEQYARELRSQQFTWRKPRPGRQ